MRQQPTTRAEWDAAYAAKHRDFKGVHSDDRHPELNGRRTMMWLVDGVTTLLVEPDWNAPAASPRVGDAPALRCNRCHRPMLGTSAYDGACACGGLIERAPRGWDVADTSVGNS